MVLLKYKIQCDREKEISPVLNAPLQSVKMHLWIHELFSSWKEGEHKFRLEGRPDDG